MNIAEIATLGTQIAELGTKLTGLRAKRDVLDTEIKEIESLIMPLVVQHSKLVASIAGIAMPVPTLTPPPVPPVHMGGGQGHPPSFQHTVEGPLTMQVKARIRADLSKMAGRSAQEIADILRVDSALVREVMREEMEKARQRTAPGEMEIVPDGS